MEFFRPFTQVKTHFERVQMLHKEPIDLILFNSWIARMRKSEL